MEQMIEPDQVEELFSQALSRPPQERSQWLEGVCGDKAELRARVEQLLAAHGARANILPLPGPADQVPAEAAGGQIGRYQLLEQIGEGGFGAVFMAEQTSPVRRRVALKIIKLGMDTRQVVARFEAERQALAMMDHQNIARVFDAGATYTGRPYFVMELVRGVPITSYCDENKLTTRQRLNLFIAVCSAVQHAHTKGIIHRDLKPSNVLVTLHDDKAVPKVIDFGVAKATQSRLTERTLFTEFRQMIGTPAYMSPEQAQMGGLDIDTRSDIYSLGVLLYELLTGTTPFDTKQLHAASFDQMQKLICETEPPRPSTRLGTLGSDRQLTTAGARRTDPRHLAQSVRGELDWIVMKCLEKDRDRRYQTASALCRDVERYLADEPVHACPPSAGYRFRKFARRNARALLAASVMLAMLLLLVAGLAVSNVRVARERNEKAAALKEKEQALARAESNFVKARTAVASILTQAAMGRGEWAQLTPGLRKIFSQETTRYYQSLIQEGNTDPAVRFETAVGYRSLGGLHIRAREFESAEKYHRHSIQMLDALRADFPNSFEYRHQLAYGNFELGAVLKATARPAEAKEAYERAAGLYEDLLAESPSVHEFSSLLWTCYSNLRDMHPAERASADLPKTRKSILTACDKLRDMGANQPAIYVSLGSILCDVVKDYDNAADCFRRAIELDPKDAYAHHNLGAALEGQTKYREAILAYRKTVELRPQYAHGHNSLSWLLTMCPDVNLRDPAEALTLAERAAKLDPNDDRLPVILGAAYYRTGNWNAAIAELEKPVRGRLGQRLDWCVLAMAQWQSGNRDAARVSYQKVVESIEKNEPDDKDVIRLRSEAADLLGIPQTQPAATAPATRP